MVRVPRVAGAARVKRKAERLGARRALCGGRHGRAGLGWLRVRIRPDAHRLVAGLGEERPPWSFGARVEDYVDGQLRGAKL